ncbi:hypothetical protein DMB95_06060 [Campylobacter sp. MIT 12-8780]|uniref:DUF945 domain-containing protein n=1 Tax=unclassified Campylobacter TaxID=2593542 RepID=UPI00115E9C72|nr:MULTISPECIES: DUF945 domain-containing protein [unclassified Campylobacter]NDJ27743.1 YdgA family protein [Campylobacter sp. MIT 19-121]TQR41049.1 hypothetical protein DMB95_06060 [Campylobacter sp. MIT 12-8780]
MKKSVIFSSVIIILFVLYLAQVAFVRGLNLKFFEQVSSQYALTDVELKKGFFSSSANFVIDDESLAAFAEPIKVEITFHNSYFAPNTFVANFFSPASLKQSIQEEIFLTLNGKFKFNQSLDLEFKPTNINFNEDIFEFKLEDFVLKVNVNKDSSLNSFALKTKEFDFSFSYLHFKFTNFAYEERFLQPVFLQDYIDAQGIVASKSHLSAENIELYDDINISKVVMESMGKMGEELDDLSIKLKIEDFKSKQMQLNLHAINLDMNAKDLPKELLISSNPWIDHESLLDNEELFELFARSKAEIVLNDFSASSKGKKFKLSGLAKSDSSNFSVLLNAHSEILPSAIFPVLIWFDMDEFFVQKDNAYTMKYELEGKNENITQIKLNDEVLVGDRKLSQDKAFELYKE